VDRKEKAARLQRLLEERAELGLQLQVSLALESAFPDIFRKGGVKTAIMGPDSNSLHVRITEKDGTEIRKELHEMPEAWLRQHKVLIRKKLRQSRDRKSWLKAAKKLELA